MVCCVIFMSYLFVLRIGKTVLPTPQPTYGNTHMSLFTKWLTGHLTHLDMRMCLCTFISCRHRRIPHVRISAPDLQNAVRGRGSRKRRRLFCDGRVCLFTVQFQLCRDPDELLIWRCSFSWTLRAELGELGEEPVAVLKEPVLVDGVEVVPVLISSILKILCLKRKGIILREDTHITVKILCKKK